MVGTDEAAQLDVFLDKYLPEVAEQGREALAAMRARLPGAVELVYDNYNALAIGFGPGERASEALFSIALYPRYVTIFFLTGAQLDDPDGILEGSAKLVRQIRWTGPDTLHRPGARALIDQALARAGDPIDPLQPGRIVIKSISAKQRPRRPG